jgi:hypothetical protein
MTDVRESVSILASKNPDLHRLLYGSFAILNDVLQIRKRFCDDRCDVAEPAPDIDYYASSWQLFPRIA